MADLISLELGLTGLPGLSPIQQSQVPAIISAASELVERWCNRQFAKASFDELYTGDGSGVLILRKFPVASIERLSGGLQTAFTVTNSDSTTNWRANAAIINTGTGGTESNPTDLVLTRYTSSGTIQNTFSFATYTTLTGLAAAINGTGGGWSATVPARFAPWSCTEIRPVQGTIGALGNDAKFRVYSQDILDFSINQGTGEVRIPSTAFWPLSPYGDVSVLWPDSTTATAGFNSYRVVYTAGFDPIPYGVQQAVVMTVQSMYQSLLASNVYKREKLFDYEYEIDPSSRHAIPRAAQELLFMYRDFRATGEY